MSVYHIDDIRISYYPAMVALRVNTIAVAPAKLYSAMA
jgi:hypothetical protein